MDRKVKDFGRFNSSGVSPDSDVFEPTSSNNAKQRASLVEWLNGTLDLTLPINASDDELRAFLIDGSILCQILNRLKPDSVTMFSGPIQSSQSRSENVERFLSAMDEMGLPRFQAADLEKGSMRIVLECLLTLQTQFMLNGSSRCRSIGGSVDGAQRVDSFRLLSSPSFGEERRKVASIQRVLRTSSGTEPSAAHLHHVGHKFHEVFQLKQGSYTDIPAAKITEMMKSNSLDNAPTQSLLSVVNGILDESIERKNGEIPHRVACLLRKVVQEIERRICTQAEHLRTQNNLFKSREDKYQSRIRVLEALATGTSEETQIVMNQLQQIKNEKSKTEEKKTVEDHEVVMKLKKENDGLNQEIETLKKVLEVAKRVNEHQNKIEEKKVVEDHDVVMQLKKETDGLNQEIETLKKDLEVAKRANEKLSKIEAKKTTEDHDVVMELKKENEDLNQDIETLKKENNGLIQEIETLKKDLEVAKRTNEQQLLKMKAETESEAGQVQHKLENRLKEVENMLTESTNRVKEVERKLTESTNRVKELQTLSESKTKEWNKKEHIYHIFTDFQLGALRELRFASQSIQQEIVGTQKNYSEGFSTLGLRIRALDDAAKNYYSVLAENRKMHNELQELKGNIRVYCRIRPFLPGQKGKQSIVDYIGDNGELTIVNPAKQGKEARISFKFDKVYGPTATQADVFSDTQPLIQSVVDGYNVCIFAYGQTGSGKTHTMTGPDGASEEEWGVNYRALNNLFRISKSRESNFTYTVSVQMVEIYNEQVRDLLSNDGTQKKLGILSTSQPNGLAVPDASVHTVNSTPDVMELMSTGLRNRAQSSTALNKRSSRSHSVVSIHVRGVDIKSSSTLRGSLHLVDLAGSERVDRSEVTGDRLKEAQHINKSLSALGDVIFALAQKSSHVPYRNSKLTQVLQSSLGGQAKTLMFVQLNPDPSSYSESLSTLKFAERVSGVELGAAKSSKDGRDVRELMEQVASLKDTIAKKDEEIETLQMLKDPKNVQSRYGYGKAKGSEKACFDQDEYYASKGSDKHSIANDDKINNISNRLISVGAETEGSRDSSPVPDEPKHEDNIEKPKSTPKIPRSTSKPAREPPKSSIGLRKSSSGANLLNKSSRRWQ